MERQTHIVVGATVAFPLMLFRQITALRYTAFLALASMCFIVCCVVQQVLSHSTEEQEAKYGPVTFFVPSISMCLALPSVCLAFQNQMQVPAIYAELRPEIKSVRNMAKIIIASKCIIIPMYVTTAFAGYYMFRTQTPPDVLDGAFAQSAVQIFVARLLLAFCAILRVPINHHTARSAVITLWKRIKQPEASETAPEPPLSFFLVEVVVFSAIMITLAMMLTSLDVVLDIMSATCAMAVMFFMPGLFFLKGQKNITSGWRTLSYAFMVIGASMACVSMCDVVANL
jgi:amino acid permease